MLVYRCGVLVSEMGFIVHQWQCLGSLDYDLCLKSRSSPKPNRIYGKPTERTGKSWKCSEIGGGGGD